MARFPDFAWWYWAAMVLALAAEEILPAAGLAAIGLGVIQAIHFWLRAGHLGALPVQVRLVFLGLLVAGLWPPLLFVHSLQLVGTLARVAFDYCVLARTLALMSWNRAGPLTLELVRRVYFTPPTPGSILAVLARP